MHLLILNILVSFRIAQVVNCEYVQVLHTWLYLYLLSNIKYILKIHIYKIHTKRKCMKLKPFKWHDQMCEREGFRVKSNCIIHVQCIPSTVLAYHDHILVLTLTHKHLKYILRYYDIIISLQNQMSSQNINELSSILLCFTWITNHNWML